MRPTRGYAFVSTTQIGGLAPDSRSLRFLRQVWIPCALFLPLPFLRHFFLKFLEAFFVLPHNHAGVESLLYSLFCFVLSFFFLFIHFSFLLIYMTGV